MSSLSGRLLASVSLLLILFFGLTIAALDFAFRDLSERSVGELLDAQLVALLAACETDDHGNVKPAGPLAETRLTQPGSGVYAEVRSAKGALIWRSPSLTGQQVDTSGAARPGERRLEKRPTGDGSAVMLLTAGIDWETAPGVSRDFVFKVATSLTPYEIQLHRFRGQLFGWFLGMLLLLLVALGWLMRWALTPLRQIESEIGEVESGGREALSPQQPRELSGLATNMNALLASERQRVERYRNTLGNLAHSLKTPLAVIRSTLAGSGASDTRVQAIDTQVDRMNSIVQHQLRRAAASGGVVLGRASAEVWPLLTELRAALTKVYGRKDLLIEVAGEANVLFAGDRGDLFELLGNLLDNACKWCHSRVRATTARRRGADGRMRLEIVVEDDGAGIAPADRERILTRGTRADEQVDGQGIGLAMVHEIVQLYGGTLEIGNSAMGGARISVALPGR